MDSQSVRTREAGGEKGYGAEKEVTGAEHHILVDTMGFRPAPIKGLPHQADHCSGADIGYHTPEGASPFGDL